MRNMMRPLLAGAVGVLAIGSTAWAGGEPGAYGPRECFGRVALPPTYESRDVEVQTQPGRLGRRYIPAVVEHGWRRELVRAASVERVATPAVYRMSYTRVTAPGPRRWIHAAARYAERDETVMVTPGHWVWARRDGPLASGPPQPGQTIVEPTGVVLCKVWCPARYAHVAAQVMVAPGRDYAVSTQVHRLVAYRALVRPAGLVERRVPAQYRQVAVSRVTSGPRTETVRISPRFDVVRQRRMVAGGEGWAPVVCGGPLSRPALAHMQASLAERGYDAGPADGRERPQTYAALRRYQIDHAQPAGQITVDSARSLGVIP